MATIINVTGKETKTALDKKLKGLEVSDKLKKKFPAHKFTGKIKSFGDPVEYQRKLRDEWD